MSSMTNLLLRAIIVPLRPGLRKQFLAAAAWIRIGPTRSLNPDSRSPGAKGQHVPNRLQLRHGRELRRLDARPRRRGHPARHLGQHRVRLPCRRPALDAPHGPPGRSARRRHRRASGLPRPRAVSAAATWARRPTRSATTCVYQIGALTAFTRDKRLQHVKPHGALYNMAVGGGDARDAPSARRSSKSIRGCSWSCSPDRRGRRSPRRWASASRGRPSPTARSTRTARSCRGRSPVPVIHDIARGRRAQPAAGHRGHRRRHHRRRGGACSADTICLHGDTPGAVQLAAALKAGLERKPAYGCRRWARPTATRPRERLNGLPIRNPAVRCRPATRRSSSSSATASSRHQRAGSTRSASRFGRRALPGIRRSRPELPIAARLLRPAAAVASQPCRAVILGLGGDPGRARRPPAACSDIPTCYGGRFGPDLPFVAEHNGLTRTTSSPSMPSGDYLVYMMGFSPGFTYLGGMSARIATPRLKTPRTSIPAGSVGIAQQQTGIYPVESPGGWQLIGRTPVTCSIPRARRPRWSSRAMSSASCRSTRRRYEAIAAQGSWLMAHATTAPRRGGLNPEP